MLFRFAKNALTLDINQIWQIQYFNLVKKQIQILGLDPLILNDCIRFFFGVKVK